MKIYTKTGDKGLTSLVSGNRVPKYHPRIEAYGTVDELNSYLGLIASFDIDKDDKAFVTALQQAIFTACSHLSMDDEALREQLPPFNSSIIAKTEAEIDRLTGILPVLNHFILPGGHQISAFCHIARTVCRRAERLVVRLAEEVPVNAELIIFLNRISDYLFVLARKQAHDFKADELKWIPSGKR